MAGQVKGGDNAAFLKMVRRMIHAAGERVSHDDPELLADLVALRFDLDDAVRAAVRGQKAAGITWQSIGEATGTTRQAAIMKWSEGQGHFGSGTTRGPE